MYYFYIHGVSDNSVYNYTEGELIVLMSTCLLLALIRRTWNVDFPLMGSDGGESLGKQ